MTIKPNPQTSWPHLLAVVLLAILWQVPCQAQPPYIIRDLITSTGTGSAGSDVEEFVMLNGVSIFAARDGINGRELWRSDGTSAGTYLVMDIAPGLTNSNPRFFVVHESVVYFQAEDGVRGRELWRTDGTTQGTWLVSDIRPGAVGSEAELICSAGGRLYYRATNGTGEALWYSDGTAAGASQVYGWGQCCFQDGTCTIMWRDDCIAAGGRARVSTSACAANQCEPTMVVCCLPNLTCAIMTRTNCAGAMGEIAPASGVCASGASCAASPVACCAANGTCTTNVGYADCMSTGGFPIQFCGGSCIGHQATPRPRPLSQVVEVGGVHVFSSTASLWAIDPVTNIAMPLAYFAGGSFPRLLTKSGDRVFFAGRSAAHGEELWVTDGTAPGTYLVMDINPGTADGLLPGTSDATEIFAIEGGVLLQATDGVTGRELWRSDGTPEGTYQVIDLFASGSGSRPRRLTEMGGLVYFVAQITAAAGGPDALFKTDGTAAGTVQLASGFDLLSSGQATWKPRAVLDGRLYLTMQTNNDRELWRTDGTPAGTLQLTFAPQATGGRNPTGLMPFADKVVFAADTSNTGRELWQTDGTAEGTTFFADLSTTNASFSSTITPGIGDVAFLLAPTPANGLELHRTAGTTQTTWMVKDIAPGAQSITIGEMVMFNNRLFFTASRTTAPAFSNLLWSTDGTDGDTLPLGELVAGSGGASDMGIKFGSQLLFIAGTTEAGSELWISDGTTAGTTLLKDIWPGPNSGMNSPRPFVEFDGSVYFSANDGASGAELWRTDGTAEGTVLFADLTPGSGGGDPRDFVVLGDTLLFRYVNALWRTDATVAGTYAINIGTGPTIPDYLFSHGGYAYFRGNGIGIGIELWRTDGTVAGTSLVKDISPGSGSSDPRGCVLHGDEILFIASGPTGLDIWRTDGTDAGTSLALDLPSSTQPVQLISYNGELYFTQSSSGRIWHTDLTLPGTTIFLSSGFNGSPSQFFEHSGLLYFVTASGSPGTGGELWRTDGTEAGTTVVLDLVPGINGSDPQHVRVMGDRFVFSAQTAEHGRELWSFDPGTGVAERLSDIAIGEPSSSPAPIDIIGDTMFFRASNPNYGSALFKTDGTAAGTVLVRDPWIYHAAPTAANLTVAGDHLYFTEPGATPRSLYATAGVPESNVLIREFPHPGEVRELIAFDGDLFFIAHDTPTGRELRRAQPAEYAFTLVADLYPGGTGGAHGEVSRVGNRLFFYGNAGNGAGSELCMSDGTAAGTVMVKDLRPGANSSVVRDIVDLAGVAVFVAQTDGEGYELWRSDGTEAGTYMILDIQPGPIGSAPQNLQVIGPRVLFTADDGVHGRELWATDGTAQGTTMLIDIWEGPGGAQPAWITAAPGRIFFTAYTPETGVELWTSNGSAFGTALVYDLVEGPSSAAVNGLTVAGSRLYFFATAAPARTSLWAIEWNTAVAHICFADYDGSGGLGVTDIFAFLTDWFASRPRADVNGDGAVTVVDIFEYLTLWFAGCQL
ncbi:MAG: hypothetical protein KF869_01580 [Phycisphaeraceae bacterium]|nr:hypothetical protein [Phycisphaeraceae bacterium]